MAATYNKDTGVLYVDNTILSTFATCPQKAAISYGLDRRLVHEDNANLEVGKALHLALEHYFLGESPEKCMEVLSANYEAWAKANVFDNKRLSWDNIRLVFLSWAQKYPQNKLPFRVEPGNIEVSFDVPLNKKGDIRFTGRMDLLAHSRYGNTLFAVDHKCTGQIDSKKKKEYSITSQMTGYLWALQQSGHDVAGIYINAVHTGQVPTSNRKCAKHKAFYEECGFLHMNHELLGPYQRSQNDLDTWHQDALSLALEWKKMLDHLNGDMDKLVDIQQRGKWLYQACTYCPWQDYCKMGQPTSWLAANTEINAWLPGVLGD